MGFNAVQAAFKVRTPSLASRVVLWALAEHLNEETSLCFPSQERIAEETGINKSSVKRAIGELEREKIISKRHGVRRGSRNASYRYRLDFYIQAKAAERKARISGFDALPKPAHGGATHPQQGISPSSIRISDGESLPGKVKKRSQKRAIKTRISEDWQPSRKGVAYAIEKGFEPAEIDAMAEHFRLFWMAHGDVRANWTATWYMWVTKRVEMKEIDHGKSRNPASGTGRQSVADGIRMFVQAGERLRAERERREGGGG